MLRPLAAALRLLALGLVVASCGGDTEEPVTRRADEPPREARRDAPADGPATAAGEASTPVSQASIPDTAPATGALTADRTPFPYPETPQVRATRSVLEGVVRTHALEPGNPWAVGHALLALGPEATLPDGESAVDHLFASFAERQDGWVRFPTSRGPVRVEPHRDLVLKALTEIGVDPNRPVVVAGEPATPADLYRGSLSRSWLEGYGDWNDVGWSLQGIAAWAPPDLAWTTEDGHESSVSGLAVAALDQLRQETAVLRRAHDAAQRPSRSMLGRAGVLGVIRFTCGGAHFIQGVAYAAGRGFVPESRLAELDEEASVALWRLSWEVPELDGAMQVEPTLQPFLLVQRLKFLGHLLETVHKLAILDLFHPTREEREEMGRAVEELARTAVALQAMGWFSGLAAFRQEATPRFRGTSNEQLYLDTVGDASHALRGLDLATGRGTLLH